MVAVAGLFAFAALISRVVVKTTIAVVGVVVVLAVAASVAFVWASTAPHANTHLNHFGRPTLRSGACGMEWE